MRVIKWTVVIPCLLGCGGAGTSDEVRLSALGPEVQLRLIASSAADVPFGAITGILADSSGRIYVADSQAQEIVVLDREGRESHRIGRKGGGPGEFSGLHSIAWSADTLAALDLRTRRIVQFTPSGHLVSSVAWPSSAGRPHRLFSAGKALIAAGRFPRSSTSPATTAAEAAAAFRQPEIRYFEVAGGEFRELAVSDTLAEPRGFDCDGPGGTIAIFGEPLFGTLGPLRAFLSTEELVSVRSGAAELDVVDATDGDTLRSISLQVESIGVTDSLWSAETSAFRERERQEGPFSCDIDDMRPATLASIRSIVIDPTGLLWSEVHVGPDQFAFVIMDSMGRPIGVAPSPPRTAAVAPYAYGDKLYVAMKDEYDVVTIMLYQMQPTM